MIEIPKDSNIKYEMDVKTGVIVVDRIVTVKMIYPCNYGYIINTREQDGDNMDAFVLGNYSLTPGSIIRSRPVGAVLSQDQEGTDSKIIAVPATKKILKVELGSTWVPDADKSDNIFIVSQPE